MKVVKLKQMAKTLIYLEEKGFADFDALFNAAADAEKRFYDLRAAIKAAEARMGEIQTPVDAHHELFQNPQRLHRLPQGGVFKKIPCGA